MHILLVEDDTDLAEVLFDALRAAGHSVRHVGMAGTGLALACSNDFDALVLDLGLPDGDGMDLVRGLRRAGCAMPIIVITARLSLDDRIVGLDSGADDYLVKPFASAELLVRMRAVARRAFGQSASLWSFGDLAIDSGRRIVSVAGQTVPLTPKEYELLHALASRAGQVVPKHRLAHALSPFGTPVDFNALEVHVHQLRKKLGTQRVRTVRGVGYALEGAA